MILWVDSIYGSTAPAIAATLSRAKPSQHYDTHTHIHRRIYTYGCPYTHTRIAYRSTHSFLNAHKYMHIHKPVHKQKTNVKFTFHTHAYTQRYTRPLRTHTCISAEIHTSTSDTHLHTRGDTHIRLQHAYAYMKRYTHPRRTRTCLYAEIHTSA